MMLGWGTRTERFEGAAGFDEVELLDSEMARLAACAGLLRLRLAEGLEALARCDGHHELGFATVEAYALERCERSARWVQGSRALARRLAELPDVRLALVSGEIGFSMAQVIASAARAEDEAWWLAEARRRTVRQLQALVRERKEREQQPAGAGQMFAVDEEPQATFTVTVDREDGWLFERARIIGKHLGENTLAEMMDALLAEGTTSLLSELDRDSKRSTVPFDDALDEHAAQRAWEGELARFREEAEVRCEAALGERMRGQTDPGACAFAQTGAGARAFPRAEDSEITELVWEDAAERIDEQLRSVAAELARRDLALGDLAERFWKADGWRRLGFATESQYERERLGMSLSAAKAKRALARRARALPRLRQAMDARALGYEAARLVAAVAAAETMEAWVERARERTVKHLREEVDAAQILARIGVERAMVPPSVAVMEKLAAFERRVVTGVADESHPGARNHEALDSGKERAFVDQSALATALADGSAFAAAFQPDGRQMSAGARATGESHGTGVPTGTTFHSDERQMFAGMKATGESHGTGARRLRSRGRVTLRFRVGVGTKRHYRWLERIYLRHGPRLGGFFRYLCLSFIQIWRQRPSLERAYSSVYARDSFRCTSPVCTRRDVTPHHLLFRSAGGDDSDENVASLCVWCHLEGVHGGRLAVAPPASAMQWSIGRRAHTVVEQRRRMQWDAFTGETDAAHFGKMT
jgi:hypothetical protein